MASMMTILTMKMMKIVMIMVTMTTTNMIVTCIVMAMRTTTTHKTNKTFVCNEDSVRAKHCIVTNCELCINKAENSRVVTTAGSCASRNRVSIT